MTNQNRTYPSLPQISPEQHTQVVKEIFSKIVGRYDFLNHLLSFRRDIAWRRFAVKQIQPRPGSIWLDVAAGTADLSLEVRRQHSKTTVLGVDFVVEMLKLGRKKIIQQRAAEQIHLGVADACNLPIADASVGTVSISFGIRNISKRLRALQEFHRVLIPDGKVVILEMAYPRCPLLRYIFGFYLHHLLPAISRIFSPHSNAYLYLGDSIANFPPSQEILNLMVEAGFVDTVCYPLTFGVPHVFVGRRPI